MSGERFQTLPRFCITLASPGTFPQPNMKRVPYSVPYLKNSLVTQWGMFWRFWSIWNNFWRVWSSLLDLLVRWLENIKNIPQMVVKNGDLLWNVKMTLSKHKFYGKRTRSWFSKLKECYFSGKLCTEPGSFLHVVAAHPFHSFSAESAERTIQGNKKTKTGVVILPTRTDTRHDTI